MGSPHADTETEQRPALGALAGYASFDQVRLSDPSVYAILKRGGTLEECVVELANQKLELVGRVNDLHRIAPRKIRQPNGSVLIYRAPEDLIPDPA